MPLAAYLPDKPSRDRSHPVADALAQNPELRAYRAGDLARATRTSRADAIEALEIITRRATGAVDRSERSLDERFSLHGRAAPAASWDDAGALRRPLGAPLAWRDAGTVIGGAYIRHPMPLGFVYQIGQRQTWPASPSNPNEPHRDTLDQLALFANQWPTNLSGSPITWAALPLSTQFGLRVLWANQLRDFNLPTDSEETNNSIQWPNAGDTLERKIFFWDVTGSSSQIANGQGIIVQRMQLQKWSNSEQKWRVYNQWGQDLLFTRQGRLDKWVAGWDLGTWLSQNEAAIGEAIRHGMEAVALGVATIFSAGAAAPLVAGAITAIEAEVQGMRALAAGDINAAMNYLSTAAQGFGNIAGQSKEGKEIGDAFRKWAQDNAPMLQSLAADAKNSFSVFAKTFDAIKANITKLDLPLFREGAKLIAKQIPKIDPIADVKKAIDQAGPVGAFFLRGYKEVTQGTIPDSVPWYARQAYTEGQTYRAAVDAQRLGAGSFVGGTILRPTLQTLRTVNLAEAQKYEATAAELCAAAETMRKANRPVEAALLQKQCDEARAKAAAARQPGQAQPSAAGGAAVPLAIGGGLLWLLLKGAAL